MALNENPNPHDVRLEVRNAAYPNRQIEEDTIRRVDRAVFDQVRTFEHQVVQAAQKFTEENEVHVAAAQEIADALKADVRLPLQRGRVSPDTPTARRLEILRLQAGKAIAALERADHNAEWHITRLADPSAAHRTLLDKFNIRRPLHF